MVYCTNQQEIYQESQRSDVATGNAGWPSQTQTQTQGCGADPVWGGADCKCCASSCKHGHWQHPFCGVHILGHGWAELLRAWGWASYMNSQTAAAASRGFPYMHRARIADKFGAPPLPPIAKLYFLCLDGQNRQSPIASDFGSRTQIAALFAILLYRSVYNESPIARFESQFQIGRVRAIRIARF